MFEGKFLTGLTRLTEWDDGNPNPSSANPVNRVNPVKIPSSRYSVRNPAHLSNSSAAAIAFSGVTLRMHAKSIGHSRRKQGLHGT